MFKFDMRDIISACTSLNVFRKGFDYYKENKVLKYTYNPDLGRIFAKVEGNDLYHIDIYIKEGMFGRAYCDCPAFHDHPKYCKHIAATLLYAKLQSDNALENKTPSLNELLDYYMDLEFDEVKGSEEVEVSYALSVNTYTQIFNLTIKIGEQQLYVLKDPVVFFGKYHQQKPFVFGKKFTFDPMLHQFSDEDYKIMMMIDDLIDVQLHHQYYETHQINKEIGLSHRQGIKLLEHLSGDIQLTLSGNHQYDGLVDIKKTDIQLAFEIIEKDKSYLLDLTPLKHYLPLTKDKRLLFHNHTLYLISKKQISELSPLFEQLENGYNSIVIQQNELDTFMSYLYPIINRTCNVSISKDLEEKIELKPCQSELYLDYHDDRVVATLKHLYGEYVFDAFKGLETVQPQQIILRDLKQENKMMHLLEAYAFKVSTSGYYLEDEGHVYRFLDEGIERLQKECTIYYSDAFSRLEVKDYDQVTIRSTLSEDMAFFNFKFDIQHIDSEEIPYILKHLREKKSYHRLKDGSFISLDHLAFHQFNHILEDLDLNPDAFRNGEIQLPSYLSMYVNEQLESLDTRFKRDEGFKRLIDTLHDPESVIFEVPQIQETELRSYQVTGYNWLKTLNHYHFGGILADDMGLGKTLQTLCYIASEKQLKASYKALIVAPTSLTYNWLSEIKKFVPHLKASVIDGVKSSREEKLKDSEDFDIIITSYALVRNDLEIYQSLDLDVCIIDEAQHIKNPSSKTAKAIKQLHIAQRFALTGTPIENSVLELWSIFDFIMPYYLGNLSQFIRRYEKPIKEQDDVTAIRLKKMIKPFILRRLKQDVLKELPDKIENKLTVELSDDQKKVYLAYLEKVKGELQEAYANEGYQKSQMKTLAALTRLRQICLDPGLFLEDYSGGSAKLSLLEELLEELMEGGHKVLLFSQFTSMLEKIEHLLGKMKIDYLKLDGSTPSKVRGQLVNDFNTSAVPVFLISLKAGGTGLNLTSADTVIHFDPWWNPAVEDQATDRAHRIGQENKVHVIKIVTQGTIEEKIYQLQEKKKALIEKVIQPGETMITSLSETEIRALFE
ncbi:MAG: DEAD/DEAH box helicase [Clostridia bacterium]|nr:DEAD/DEAH box helicase [Clostridia bacterium]